MNLQAEALQKHRDWKGEIGIVSRIRDSILSKQFQKHFSRQKGVLQISLFSLLLQIDQFSDSRMTLGLKEKSIEESATKIWQISCEKL